MGVLQINLTGRRNVRIVCTDRDIPGRRGALSASPICAFASPRRPPTIRERQENIRAARDEQRSDARFTAVLRAPKRRISGYVSRVNVRAAVQQGVGYLRVPSPGRHVERGAPFGAAGHIHLRSRPNQRPDDVATAGHLAFVRHAIQRSAPAWNPYVGVGAKAKEQLDHPQAPVRRRVVKKGSAVPVVDVRHCRIGQQFAFGVLHDGTTAASHHQPQHMRERRAIAREPTPERRTARQLKSAASITIANGGYKIIQRTLFAPSLRNFAVDAIA